jgi:hypothetical protein
MSFFDTEEAHAVMLAQPARDIAKWHVKLKMLFIIDQLQVLFDDMFSHTCYNMDIVNIVILLINGLNSMVILKVVIYGPLRMVTFSGHIGWVLFFHYDLSDHCGFVGYTRPHVMKGTSVG